MVAPIKKRLLDVDDRSAYSTSDATFESPDEDEGDYEHADKGIVGSTFQVPSLPSQGSIVTAMSPQLGTQPPMNGLTTPRPSKKRKVSLSPVDSLARNKRNSPKGQSQVTVDTLIVVDDEKSIAKLSTASKQSPQETRVVEVDYVDAQPTPTPTTAKVASKKSKSKKEKEGTSKSSKSTTKVSTKSKKTSPQKKRPTKAPKGSSVTTGSDSSTTNEKPKTLSPSETSTQIVSNETSAKEKATTPAPKKKKRTFQDQLLHQLFMTCRPYTLKTLAQALNTSEAAVNFCLLSLVDKGWVVQKEFSSGKRAQVLFWANQTCTNKELLSSLQLVPAKEIEHAHKELEEVQKQCVAATKEYAKISKGLSTIELNEQLRVVQEELEQMEKGNATIRSRIRAEGKSNGNQRLKIQRKINQMRAHWKDRKDKCMDFVDNLADAMEKKPKQVVSLLELETDEMANVTMPPKQPI